MGGGSYDRDVGHSSSSGSFSSGGTSSSSARSAMGSRHQPDSTKVYNRRIESKKESPVVINLDVTGSNIEFARIVYDKAPMLYGQIEQQGYLKDFDICFSATGDANSDSCPIQVCDFNTGIELDSELKKLYLEGGGGGQCKETYELSAYYFAHYCDMENAKTPFIFFIVDEAPYNSVNKKFINEHMGDPVSETVDSKQAFSDLFKAFHGNVFIFQNKYNGSESRTDEIRLVWEDVLGDEHKDHLIPIKEEKSIVDLILGVIAMVSGSRSLVEYTTDMVSRGQSGARVAKVEKSLETISKAIVPKVNVNLPSKPDSGKKRTTARKL